MSIFLKTVPLLFLTSFPEAKSAASPVSIIDELTARTALPIGKADSPDQMRQKIRYNYRLTQLQRIDRLRKEYCIELRHGDARQPLARSLLQIEMSLADGPSAKFRVKKMLLRLDAEVP